MNYDFDTIIIRRGHALTGMGINPRWRENRPEPIGNGRYRMLLHHLKSYSKYGGAPRFHDHPDFGLFSCASQAQVDVCEDTVVPTINAFNALEPFKAVLLAHVLMYDVVKRCKKELQRRRINV